jgi:hypothetical protein
MKHLVLVSAFALIVACSPAANVSPEKVDVAQGATTACEDGSTPLPGTRLCQSDAAALLVRDPNVRTPELEGCTWVVGETMLPVDEAILYYAAQCGERTTAFGFAGGAERAEISYTTSAKFGDEAADKPVFWLYGTDPDPQGALKAMIAELPADEQAKCEIRTVGYEGWPADVLQITLKDTARAGTPENGIFTACGPFGVSDQSIKYWRVRQGYAWFFDLPLTDPDFDAGNMAVVVKGADGKWAVKP